MVIRWPNSIDWVDIGVHVLIAVVFVALVSFFVAPLFVAVFNALIWIIRELWQHDWKLKKMGGQSHMEYFFPAVAGGLVAAVFEWVEASIQHLI